MVLPPKVSQFPRRGHDEGMHDPHDRHGLPARPAAVGRTGWHLLLQLHEQLLTHVPDYWVDDLKEKFGTTRVRMAPRRVRTAPPGAPWRQQA